jgi:hypothetical protein
MIRSDTTIVTWIFGLNVVTSVLIVHENPLVRLDICLRNEVLKRSLESMDESGSIR